MYCTCGDLGTQRYLPRAYTIRIDDPDSPSLVAEKTRRLGETYPSATARSRRIEHQNVQKFLIHSWASDGTARGRKHSRYSVP